MDGNIRPKRQGPGQTTRTFVELREMKGPESTNSNQNPAGAADLEICPPDLRPASSDRHAPLNGRGLPEPLFRRFPAKKGFQPRSRNEENLEICV